MLLNASIDTALVLVLSPDLTDMSLADAGECTEELFWLRLCGLLTRLLCREGWVGGRTLLAEDVMLLRFGAASNSCEPGRAPKRGKSNWKSLVLLLLLLLLLLREANLWAEGGEWPMPALFMDILFLYSRSSACNRST